MSIYSKSVADLKWPDIYELLEQQASEHERLEFKQGRENGDVIAKDELVKKVSAFANTYGGYIIIGAEEKDSKVVSLPGVALQRSFDQKVISWCFEGIYPPVVPEVSAPIPVEGTADRFIYVIFVEESPQAPHFVNKREGCYVRTGEQSQRLQPRLATLPELEHLLARRERAVERRRTLVERAEHRFWESYYWAKGTRQIPSANYSLCVTALPRFPGTWVADMSTLRRVAHDQRLSACQIDLPAGGFQSQARGFYFINPSVADASYLELDAEGLLFYREVHETEPLQEGSSVRRIDLTKAFARVVFYLRYFAVAYHELGFKGTLLLRVALDGLRGKVLVGPWLADYEANRLELRRLDDSITVDAETTVGELGGDRAPILRKLYRGIALSSGCREAYEYHDEGVDTWIKKACKYLCWKGTNG